MLPVGPKPILEHTVEWLKDYGIREIVICIGYLGRMVKEYFGDGGELGVRIQYATSIHPLGTAGQLKSAEDKIKGTFLCLYGDALLRFDIGRLFEFHRRKRSLATMVLMEYSTELKYGFIETDRDGRLTSWREKPRITGYINVGAYAMEKRFLDYIPKGRMYGMDAAFQEAMKAKERLYGFKTKGEFVDIGDRRSYREANEAFTKRFGKVL